MSEKNDYGQFEPCEMCGELVVYGFSLCDECSDKVKYFNEVTGNYHMKDGTIIDTTKVKL